MRPPRLPLTIALALAAPALAAQEPAATPPPSAVTEPELVTRLSRALDSLTALDRFSGVVLLARHGTTVFHRAYGWADREARRAVDTGTAFNLASLNKLFTATAIRQLAGAGTLDLDAPLGRYWPDYPNAALRAATIRQLLEHRSGIGGNIFDAPARGTRRDLRHNRDFLPLFVNEPLVFAPGAGQRYANAGYVVLGMLIERVSGEDYYDYVRRHITGPAGMTRTGHFAIDSLPPNTAIGYTHGGPGVAASGPLRPNSDLLPGRGSAAGGGYSTTSDLLRFVMAARAGRIPGAPEGQFAGAGGAPGINTLLSMDGPGGYDLIVLTNLDPPVVDRVAEMVAGWLGATIEVEGGPRRVIRQE